MDTFLGNRTEDGSGKRREDATMLAPIRPAQSQFERPRLSVLLSAIGWVLFVMGLSPRTHAQSMDAGDSLVEELWTYTAQVGLGPSFFAEHPRVVDEPHPRSEQPVVFCSHSTLTALKWETGQRLWEQSIDTPSIFAQVMSFGGYVVGCYRGGVHCWRISDGSPVWTWPIMMEEDGCLVSIMDQVVVVQVSLASRRYRMVGLDLASGSVVWQSTWDCSLFLDPFPAISTGGLLLVRAGPQRRGVAWLDPRSGGVVRKIEIGSMNGLHDFGGRGVLTYGSDIGVVVIDADTGRLRHQWPVSVILRSRTLRLGPQWACAGYMEDTGILDEKTGVLVVESALPDLRLVSWGRRRPVLDLVIAESRFLPIDVCDSGTPGVTIESWERRSGLQQWSTTIPTVEKPVRMGGKSILIGDVVVIPVQLAASGGEPSKIVVLAVDVRTGAHSVVLQTSMDRSGDISATRRGNTAIIALGNTLRAFTHAGVGRNPKSKK